MEIRINIPFPEDPAKRALVIAIVCSILLHLALLASLFTMPSLMPSYVKRGEPLFVDIAPDKPEEKAPLGNPARPVGPPEAAPRPPEPPAPRSRVPEAPPPKAPPAPKVQPAPKAAPKAAPRPAPEPPRQVAKAEPPPPELKAPAPRPPEPTPSQDALSRPEPAPKAPEPVSPPQTAAPAPAPDAPRGLAAPPAVPPGISGERSGPQTALAKPPPSIFRQPGSGGGGLRGGRGGVEGEPIPLDTPEPKYQDYFNQIRERIRSKWIYPREAGDRGLQGELMLEFHIAKDGRLEFLELRSSSGAEILDRFAMNAVRLAQPFPPVPDAIAKSTLPINGMFRYQIIGASLLNQYLR